MRQAFDTVEKQEPSNPYSTTFLSQLANNPLLVRNIVIAGEKARERARESESESERERERERESESERERERERERRTNNPLLVRHIVIAGACRQSPSW